MAQRLLVLVGTRKGAFVLEPSADRTSFAVSGPYCNGWPVQHMTLDPRDGALLAAAGSPWYGQAVWRSEDLGATWTHSSEGLTYGEDGPAMRAVWHVTPANGALYAGVEPAGLFRSDDGGRTWQHVKGLTDHPSRPGWAPGNGGLILHTILPHPDDPQRMWVAISAVGCFATEDGGKTWEARNKGVRTDFLPGPAPETGQCVHKMALATGDPERLYQQNHCGTYRSDDAGRTWINLDEGLPSTFGFPLVTSPVDGDTFFTVPLNGDDRGRFMPDGRMAVWRTTDRGATWHDLRNGLPQHDAYLGVLRDAMARDTLDPFGLYVGTSAGQLFSSADEGGSWRLAVDFLPPISSVEAVLVDA